MTVSPISIATDGFIVPEGTGGEGGNSRSFVGSTSGSSSVSGVLQVPAIISMLGYSTDSASNVSGVLQRTVGLIGVSSGVSVVAGALERLKILTGTSSGATSTTASLAVDFVLEGTADGRAQTIGHMDGGTGPNPALTLLVTPRRKDD